MWKPMETRGARRDLQKKMFVEGSILFGKQEKSEKAGNVHSFSLYALRHNNGILLVPSTEENRKVISAGLADIEKTYTVIERTPDAPEHGKFLTSLLVLQEKRGRSKKHKENPGEELEAT